MNCATFHTVLIVCGNLQPNKFNADVFIKCMHIETPGKNKISNFHVIVNEYKLIMDQDLDVRELKTSLIAYMMVLVSVECWEYINLHVHDLFRCTLLYLKRN